MFLASLRVKTTKTTDIKISTKMTESTEAEAETLPTCCKDQLTGKDPDGWKSLRAREEGGDRG